MFKSSLVVSLLTVSALAIFPSINETRFDRDTVVNANWENVLKPGEVLGFNRMFRDLEQRQTCVDSGYTLCNNTQICCPTDGRCCLDGTSSVVGCCIAGYHCASSNGQHGCAPSAATTTTAAEITPATPSATPPTTTIPLPSTFSPFTAAATSFAITLAGNPPQPTGNSGGLGALSQLYQCAPCGSNKCSFSAYQGPTTATFSLIVGTPIQNCDGSASIQNTIQGTIALVDTWSMENTVGLNVGSLKLEGSANWEQTDKTMWSQSVQISVDPGLIGAMIVNITYLQTSGIMNFGNGQTTFLYSNQPLEVVSYGSEIIPCNTSFPANESVSFQCTSAAPTWLKATPLSTTSFIPMAVVVLLLVSL